VPEVFLMKLYYSPFACSLASHIACREAGLEVSLERSDLATKRVEGGEDLFGLNPLGQVPTLMTDIADRAPQTQLAPAHDQFERYELSRWLSFVGTELHKKGLALIFAPDTPDAVKDFARASIHKPLQVVEAHLATREVLIGQHFTVADAYLFWALTVAPFGGVSLDAYPALQAYQQRQLARPAVRAALRYERDQRERPFAA
jgi:glutathione S-transferase